MTKYQQFLESIDIIPEDLFNKVIDSLPEVDIDLIDFELNEADSLDDIVNQIITYILQDWDCVYVDSLDFENKTFSLEDVQSLNDLNEIKEVFSKWTISNYDELKEDLEKEVQLSKEEKEFDNLINTIKLKANLVQLQKFVEEL